MNPFAAQLAAQRIREMHAVAAQHRRAREVRHHQGRSPSRIARSFPDSRRRPLPHLNQPGGHRPAICR